MLSDFPLLGAEARVYGADGKILQESVGSAGPPTLDPRTALAAGHEVSYPAIAGLAPALHRDSSGAGVFRVLHDAQGERWRAYVLPIAGGGAEYLAAMRPLEQIDLAVATFGRLIIIAATLASVAAFLAGWLLAQRALRPVAALTAGAIAQSRAMSRRVANVGEGDELGRLATTFNEILGSQEEAYQAQHRFISAASHELRAPLTVVQANLELLQRGTPEMTEEERTRAVGEAYAEAKRMARLVSDLLSLARADAGVPLRREPVELDRVLIDVVGEVRHLSSGQQLEFATFEPVVVQGDPDRLKQLVLILLDNAIKYTAANGRVTVSLRRTEGSATIDIADTGVGIAPEDLPRVFERFYRAEPARSRDAWGTGLGLSIARWIAEEHGGTVVLASALGQGTTATVRLPSAE